MSSETQRLTPHGPDFSFIDTAILLLPDSENGSETAGAGARSRKTVAVATKYLDPALPFFAHHFPGQPLMPGVLMIEAAAQAAGWLWSQTQSSRKEDENTASAAEKTPQPLHLAAVQGFRFIAPVLPGDTLSIEVSLDKELGALAQFSAVLSVAGRPVAEGRISLSRPVGSEEEAGAGPQN